MYDYKLLTKAMQFDSEKNEGVVRKRSESTTLTYILHSKEVASIAVAMNHDVNAIVATMLYDVVENTCTIIETIREEFNDVISCLFADQSENKRDDLP